MTCLLETATPAHVTLARRSDRSRNLPPQTAEERKREQVRWDLVNRVRAEIAAGIYETEEKWEQALDRLLEDTDGR